MKTIRSLVTDYTRMACLTADKKILRCITLSYRKINPDMSHFIIHDQCTQSRQQFDEIEKRIS